MYLSNNGVRDFYAPKKVILRRQPSSVSPIDNNYDSVDSISIDSYDRTSSPRQSLATPATVKSVRIQQLSQNTQMPAKVIKSVPWYKSGKSLLIAAGIFLLVAILVVVPTVLAIVLTRDPTVTITATPVTIVTTAYWTFDNTVNDINNTYTGTLGGGATYNSASYFGYGAALQLSTALSSYVSISSPFFNLSYASLTVESWIYLSTVVGDNALFSQCECGGCHDRCLSLIIRNGKLYMSFGLDDLIGSTSLAVNTWYHVAYVYNYPSGTQSVYLQGILDGTRTSVGPYQGQSGIIIIGASNLSSNYYNGYIDELRVTTMAKSAAVILSDASLVGYFSFDGSALTQDMGPNNINGAMQNAASITGKVGQALAFSGSLSYLQAYGFYQLGQTNKSFSLATWIYPYSVIGGNIIQRSKLSTTAVACFQFIGLNNVGQIVFFISTTTLIVGPFISANQWTHLGYTYSTTNGLTMYINGAQYGKTGSVTYTGSTFIDWLTVGWSSGGCIQSPIVNNYFQGAVDEFYVYRRELAASEISSLANP